MNSMIDPAAHSPLDLFQRTYRSLLRSSGEIQIEAMVEPYMAAEPVLHEGARNTATDAAALIYSALRLPTCIDRVRLVLLAQSLEVFAQAGRDRNLPFAGDGHDMLSCVVVLCNGMQHR